MPAWQQSWQEGGSDIGLCRAIVFGGILRRVSAPRSPLQDFLCGIRGKDFVMVCSDTTAVQSIVVMKQDEDKLVPVDSHKLFAVSGEAGDRVNFSEYIIANVRLYALRNGATLSTKAVANYTRSELATALRKVRWRRQATLGCLAWAWRPCLSCPVLA